jgi:hypothetical protein
MASVLGKHCPDDTPLMCRQVAKSEPPAFDARESAASGDVGGKKTIFRSKNNQAQPTNKIVLPVKLIPNTRQHQRLRSRQVPFACDNRPAAIVASAAKEPECNEMTAFEFK